MKKITILGAGITGLSLGSFLIDKKHKVEILEKAPTIGGMTKSFKYKKNMLDFGPHKLYSQIPGIVDEYKRIAGKDNLLKVEKKNSLWLLGKRFSFPAKIPQLVLGINPIKSSKLGLGFAITTIKSLILKKKSKTYEDYFLLGFGKSAYNLLFKDLAFKVWGNPKTLSEELARKRVPVPNVFELLFSGKGKDSEGKELSAKYFYYPKRGGVGFITDKYAEDIKKHEGKVITGTKIEKINIKNKKVVSLTYKTLTGSITTPTDFVASTIYLKDMLEVMYPKPPKKVIDAANGLKYRALILVYLIVKKPKVMEDNWIFFPERKYIFNRISEHNSFNRKLVEKGKSIITAEITCEFDSDIYNSSEEYIFRRVMDGLEDTSILKESKIEEYIIKKAGRIYPVYDLTYRKNLGIILKYLDEFENVITLGRQGLYNYNNTDHCIDMSMKASEYIESKLAKKTDVSKWQKNRKYFDSYRIVD